ncbi:MAG: DUF4389 domain-containing protein [Candidatus Norongarragalinales archaeon]
MKTLNFDVKYDAKASRKELLVRLVYWIPLVIVLWILSLIGAICWVIQLLYIIFTGKRQQTLFKWIKLAVEYRLKFSSYYFLLTKERPEIIPPSLK